MALFLPILGPLSGKLGGNVFSHNRNGQYVRQFVIPTNPNTTEQNDVRGYLGQCATRWGSTLTGLQRNGWRSYAETMPLVNSMGATYYLTGLQAYTRTNVSLRKAGLAFLDDAPVINGECPPATFDQDATPPCLRITDSASAAPNRLLVDLAALGTFDPAQDDFVAHFWRNTPHGVGRTFPLGPRVYLGQVIGDATTPPTAGSFAMNAGALSIGTSCRISARLVDPSGRVSPIQGIGVAVTNVP